MTENPYRTPGHPLGKGVLLSQQAILEELQQVWVDALEVDPDEVVTCPDRNMIDWLESLGVYDDLDFGYLYTSIRRHFGVTGTMGSFDRFLTGRFLDKNNWERVVRPTLTLGRLADWIGHNSVRDWTTPDDD